ncbi:hypothetical protein [Candidatus Thiodictyon syntrophicum]|jgi:hypothetical protein|uniref:hypothetical protein n=1 Tax=Candidatus Thiodictyon syntrophicum TaxID=1166950 RepID=UPI0012FE48A8|nr:hypothetical protein [Candidatus Thiodictyon syntrophicum]
MGPKYLLWIAFSVVSSTWYALDPAAHPLGDTFAQKAPVEIQQLAQGPLQEVGPRTAMR